MINQNVYNANAYTIRIEMYMGHVKTMKQKNEKMVMKHTHGRTYVRTDRLPNLPSLNRFRVIHIGGLNIKIC